MRYLIWLAAMLLLTDVAWADPLDAGEGYVNRGAPEMLGIAGLTMMMLNYVLFALAAVVFGRALIRNAPWLLYCSALYARPYSFLLKREEMDRHAMDIPLTVVMTVTWIFICQGFNELGLGAVAMIGLAFMAVLVLKILKS